MAISTRHFSERNGLPSRQAYSVETDTAGFVWVYTSGGLARYDGSDFRHYQLYGGSRPRNFADFATLTGRKADGYLWVSLNSGQVYGYNPMFDRFDEIVDLSETGEGTQLQNVLFRDDDILLSTSDGIYRVGEGSTERLALPGKVVNSLVEPEPQVLYATSTDGMYRVRRGDNRKYDDVSPVANSAGLSMDKMALAAGKIFAGSFANGVFVVDSSAPLRIRPVKCRIPGMPVTDLDARGNSVFVTVDGAGIYEIDAVKENIIRHYSSDAKNGGLSANTVSGLCFDSDGGIWISNSSNGIDCIDNVEDGVSVIRHDDHDTNTLVTDCVNKIFQDSDGDLWYGTDAGVSLRQKNGRWQHFLSRDKDVDNNFLSISQAPDGTVYAGGYGTGVWAIDKGTGRVRRLPSREGDRGIATDYIFEIYCDGDNLWFGGIRGDLTRYDIIADKYYYYPSECICDMSDGPGGALYITGCDGVAVYNGGKAFAWNRSIGDIEISTYTRDAAYDAKKNEMWYATDGQGLIRQNLETGEAEIFDIGEDSANANVYGTVIDSSDNLWFFTEHDLYVTDSNREKVLRVTPLLKLDEVSFIARSILLDNSGKLHIGTVDGVVTVDPAMILREAMPVKIILNDIEINHRKATVGEAPLAVSPAALDRLVLAHGQNTFSVRFSALNLGDTRRYSYRWRLKGYDNEWRTADVAREIICHNIPHGEYELEILAVDNVGGDVVGERILPVTVKPPFWLTWWAKLCYVFLAVALAWLVVLYVRRRQREQRITDKIHSFLSIVHDLRAPVTLIKAPLGEIENRADLPEDTIRNARLAMSNVDKLLGMIGKLLDLRRESQHSDCLNLTRADLRDYLSLKVAEWRVAAIQKGLRIEVSVPDDMPEVTIDSNKLGHILDNLLSNAIKYTFAGSVTIAARFDRKTWTLEIADTGIGIPTRDRGRLFRNQYRGENAISTDEIGSGMGLLIVHRLCRLHKVKVSVSSRENRGTTVTLVFPREIKAPVRRLPQGEAGMPEAPVAAQDSGKETIVLIDDEKDILDYLQQSLSDTYNVMCYSGADEALAELGNVSPDIIVSDVRLKGMSGFELCQKVKTSLETSHIPVILLSALSERQNIILGLESGANDYIIKPFDISVLRLRIRNILASRRQMQSRIMAGEEQPDKEDAINGLDREFMERIRSVIDDNMGDSDYSIADLCRDMGMSRTTIYNKIKALSGESINEYIRVRRLNKAKELLESRSHTISEVAYMTGFSDPKYFSTCFKKQFGISPSKL